MPYATQLCRFIWSSFDQSQVMPGVLLINLTFVSGILCGISSGAMQGKAEDAVRKEKPGEFPPTPMEIALAAWKAEREKLRAELRGGATADPATDEEPSRPKPGSGPSAQLGDDGEGVNNTWSDVEMGAAQPPLAKLAPARSSSGASGAIGSGAEAEASKPGATSAERIKTSVHRTSGDL